MTPKHTEIHEKPMATLDLVIPIQNSWIDIEMVFEREGIPVSTYPFHLRSEGLVAIVNATTGRTLRVFTVGGVGKVHGKFPFKNGNSFKNDFYYFIMAKPNTIRKPKQAERVFDKVNGPGRLYFDPPLKHYHPIKDQSPTCPCPPEYIKPSRNQPGNTPIKKDELKLVISYCNYMRTHCGNDFNLWHKLLDNKNRLYCDLWDARHSRLIEAKIIKTRPKYLRPTIREAFGQLYDYKRLIDAKYTKCGILLNRPIGDSSILSFLARYRIAVIWKDGAIFRSNKPGWAAL